MSVTPVKITIDFDDPALEFLIPHYEEKFFVDGSFTKMFKLISSKGFVSVDIDNTAGTLEKIVIIPMDTVLPATKTTVRFTIDDYPNPSFNIDLPVKKYFLWNVHEDFEANISNMYIKTDSIIEIKILVAVVYIGAPPSEVD